MPRFVALLLVVAVAAFAFLFASGSLKSRATEPLATGPEASIERGEYLALAGNCSACHTVDSKQYMAGGMSFDTPFGKIVSTNITPDEKTGIGAWSLQDFADSMRHGVRPDGTHLYPVFPYEFFTRITDADLHSLFIYLRSIPPVDRPNENSELNFPFNIRALLAVWKGMFFEPGPGVDSARSGELERGRYLVDALAHCGACHSPRNFLGGIDADLAMSGGRYKDKVPGGASRFWSAPNLTSSTQGLGLWSAAELTAYLKFGRNGLVDTFGPMTEVVMHSTRNLDSNDI